jgi:hypothetical protein
MIEIVKFKIFTATVIFLILLSGFSEAGSLQISGGVDGRYVNTNGNENDIVLEGLFLNLRKVVSDEKGDRLIAVGQIDLDNNFKDIRPYQTYLQYKGPLGKWNIRAGHYILPFGLLSDYDTERLILKTIEDLSWGIKLDTGVELLGFFKDFDYAVSLSQGAGRNRLTDADSDKLLTARLGWQGEDIDIGISGLIGEVLTDKNSLMRQDLSQKSVYEKRIGLDITKFAGPLILRGEFLIGEDGKETVGGGLLKADYALTPKLELNLKYAHWRRSGGRNFMGTGFSYEVVKGLFLRIADEYQFGKENENAATMQTYFEFAKQF